MIEKGIYSLLTEDAGVSALVGTRVYPQQAPPGAGMPYIVFERTDTDHLEDLDGSCGAARADIGVTCWSSTYDSARGVAEAVRLAANGFSGTKGTVVIQSSNIVGDRDAFDFPGDGGELGVRGVDIDLSVWFTEATS